MAVPVQIAEEEGVILVVETGNNAMITSGFLARKLIDELGKLPPQTPMGYSQHNVLYGYPLPRCLQ